LVSGMYPPNAHNCLLVGNIPVVLEGCGGIECYGECILREGTPACQCPPGTHGNAAMPGGCFNSTLTGAGEPSFTRLIKMGRVLLIFP
jgi:hypothetical protein